MKQKTIKQSLQESMERYGVKSLTDNELLLSIGYKKTFEDFRSEETYKVVKELIRREIETDLKVIRTSNDTRHLFSFLEEAPREEFWIAYLKRNNSVIAVEPHATGGLTGVVVDRRLIFKKAIMLNAVGIILCHNHPSGNINPSEPDNRLTSQISECGLLMDINVLDHIIIGSNGKYYSYRDEGNLHLKTR